MLINKVIPHSIVLYSMVDRFMVSLDKTLFTSLSPIGHCLPPLRLPTHRPYAAAVITDWAGEEFFEAFVRRNMCFGELRGVCSAMGFPFSTPVGEWKDVKLVVDADLLLRMNEKSAFF